MRVSPEVIVLIKQGFSVNKIRRITGRAKSTIYYHYKKIKGKKQIPMIIRFNKDDELGEFLGLFAGDGSVNLAGNYHYQVRVHLGYNEKQYVAALQDKFVEWFSKEPEVHFRNYNGRLSRIDLYYSSKPLYLFLKSHLFWEGKKTYSVKLRDFDLKKKKFNIGFLRGLIDTDGNYYKPKKRLSFSTVSKGLAKQAYEIFKHNLGIEPKIFVYKKVKRADLYTIYVHGDNAINAIELIKPRNQNKRY